MPHFDRRGAFVDDIARRPQADYGRCWKVAEFVAARTSSPNESRPVAGCDRQDRIETAEVHFDMPALAGILRELESEPFVRDYFERRTPQATLRTKQALGVLVKLHMEARGWSTTGTKGPLGRRDPGYGGRGDHNGPPSFSRYLQSAERYQWGNRSCR